ncbi:probable prolyl 4-hydroxylase 12 [Mercurialis annua]|uniref:probable prolyl 4-hydroxylase 12 n=1 Tax=Mercurialis annua TaxID=3986 RepID=UPI00215E49C6|nr:probable prolyl 4-hydroxylase 12 [Mercurialis annua]
MASGLHIFLFMALTASAPFSINFAESRKKLRDKEEVKHGAINQSGSSSIQTNNRINHRHVVQLSWRPRVFLYKDFLTDEECDHLISLRQGLKETSAVKGDGSSNTVENNIQLPSSKSVLNINDNLLARIDEKISAWTFIPKGYGMPLEVMHYGLEEANHHSDYFSNRTLISKVPLMATLVLYLSNVTQGGEILFPETEPKNKVWSDCTKGSSKMLRPVKGNAVLFFNVHLNASHDTSSTHARCPVLEGEMWSATKHFLIRAIDTKEEKSLPESDAIDCTDEDANCPKWAELGECQRNPVFMTGSPDYYGTCRRSCNAC